MKALMCLILAIAILPGVRLAAQDTVTVQFTNPHQHIGPYGNGSGGTLFRFHTDSVFYFDGAHHVTLPKQVDIDKAAFGFEYFTGLENPAIENTPLVVVDDYRAATRRLYVDYNGNLDLTDDGGPMKLGVNDTVTARFTNSSNADGLFPLEYAFAQPLSPEIRERANSFWNRYPWAVANGICDSDYWLWSRRLNGRVTRALIGGDSVLIGVSDVNCDGLYNISGEDRVIVGNYKTGVISDRLSDGAYTIMPKTLIEINGHYYEVVEVEEAGRYLRLVTTDRKPQRLNPGDLVPDFGIVSLAGDSTSLYGQLAGSNYYLLDAWGTWCFGCGVQLPRLKEVDSLHTNLSVIGLNFYDTAERAQKYVEEKQIKWFNGQCDESVMDLLLLDKFPYYVLLDSEKRIVQLSVNLQEVEGLLKQ
jgi:hypothetical protein